MRSSPVKELGPLKQINIPVSNSSSSSFSDIRQASRKGIGLDVTFFTRSNAPTPLNLMMPMAPTPGGFAIAHIRSLFIQENPGSHN